MEPVKGHRWDTGTVLQFGGGAGGERAADDPTPGGFPGLTCGAEHIGLAGPGCAFNDVHARTGPGDLLQHAHLFGRQRRPNAHRGIYVIMARYPDPFVTTVECGVDHSLLGGEHLRGAPASLVDVGDHDLAVTAADHVARAQPRRVERNDTIGR